ncbi:hypothetical protein MFM001_06620 [Mycobacterium sp. MFM001]|nr:hypothetical protein MFM001_06620 [Mycobacterium sp. MFM001]
MRMGSLAIRVKVVDEKGRTVCMFCKQTHVDNQMRPEYTEAWAATAKPMSEKWLAAEDSAPTVNGRLAGLPTQTVDGQKYLQLPGLTLKWQKVESVLERVAFASGLVDASGAVLKDELTPATLSVAQLRKFAQRL